MMGGCRGNRSAPRLRAARVLGRHHPGVTHHLRGLLKAAETAEFCGERDRRYFCDTTQCLQRMDDGSQLLGRNLDSAIDGPVEALNAMSLVVNLEDQLHERGVLLGVSQLQASYPLPPGGRPRSAVVCGSKPIAQQVLAEAMLGTQLVL